MTEAMALKNVCKAYKEVKAVNNVSIEAHEGEILGILGPSGAGKSTLLRLMDLLEAPDEGSVTIHGEVSDAKPGRAPALRRSIGMVLQKPVVLNRSVQNNLAYALRIRGVPDDELKPKVDSALERFGLTARKGKNARTLSGGEMQRLSFARALIHRPSIVLLDEFAANLDPANVAHLEKAIREYAAEDTRRCVVLVTHNLFQARRMCDTVALMWDGDLIELAQKEKFFGSPEDPRTSAFVSGELVY